MSFVVSETEIRLLSELPVDVVRVIFEKVMENRPTPVQMALVSRQVRAWVEPLIYKHLRFRWPWGPRFDEFCRTFYTSPTKNAAFYRQNVKSFIIDPLGDSDQRGVRKVIKRMTGLQSIICLRGYGALDALLDSFKAKPIVDGSRQGHQVARRMEEDVEETYPYKNLRELGLPSNIFFAHDITFDHRIFRDLTHLIFAYFSPDLAYESLQHLSTLTHLAFKTMGVNIDLEGRVALLLDAFPSNLRVIVFGCVNGYNEDFDLMTSDSDYIVPTLPFEAWHREHPLLSYYSNSDVNELHIITRMTIGEVDPRIVVGSSYRLAPGHLFWEDVIPLLGICYWESEYWSIAEGVIERRRSYTKASILSKLRRQL